MIAMHLLLLAALVSIAATRLLPKARWVYQAPGLGLAAWYAVLATVIAAALGAAMSLLARWPATTQTMCAWWALCVDVLSGQLGTAGRIAGWLTVAAIGVLTAVSLRRLAHALRVIVRARRTHREALTVIGRPHPDLDAYVVEDARPAAYALPGRQRQVVITTGALDLLPQPQVAAILAHEHVHTSRHHHLLLTGVRLLNHAFPSIGVFAGAHSQIDRLVELHADDIATGQHHRLDLARALVTCAEAAAAPRSVPLPASAIAAHGGDALERVQRLLQPPPALPTGQRLTVTVTLAALTLTPIMVGALGVLFPALGACLPTASP